ncbi:membrane protein [Lysinibacillus sp. A1]|nr:membrane protein [Lysinibacillus fusiformis]KHK48970.1 membrane protein [Lysinibacillus sp. A1]
MSNIECPQCGAPADITLSQCKYCGEKFSFQSEQPRVQQPAFQQPVQPAYQAQPQPAPMYDGIDPSWPIKSKGLAGFLAIFFGGIGIHKFYLGKVFQGILYLVFCWTYIPVIISFIEGIIYLLSSEHNFSVKHRVRTR